MPERRSRVLCLACAASASAWATSSLTWLVTSGAPDSLAGSRAFLQISKQAALASRREALLSPAVATSWLVTPGNAFAEQTPLPPPVVKDLERAAPKIQGGVDWFYFELLPALQARDLAKSRNSLGSVGSGARGANPLESEIVFPLSQLASANIEADEDGWLTAITDFQVAMSDVSGLVGSAKWADAVNNWKKGKVALNRILQNINDRADKPPFVVMTDSYKDRKEAYLQKKTDSINFKNGVAVLAMPMFR